jgi:hypothetical protein
MQPNAGHIQVSRLSLRDFVSWSRRYSSHVSGDTIIPPDFTRVLGLVYYIRWVVVYRNGKRVFRFPTAPDLATFVRPASTPRKHKTSCWGQGASRTCVHGRAQSRTYQEPPFLNEDIDTVLYMRVPNFR